MYISKLQRYVLIATLQTFYSNGITGSAEHIECIVCR